MPFRNSRYFLLYSGCGAFNCDTKLVAKGMLFEADRILQAKNSTVRQVSIIIEKTKQTVFDTFKGMLEVQIASRLTAKGNDLPLEWTAIDDEYPLRIGLSSSSEEYRSILGALRETLSEAQTQSARVERIQNTRWYCQYQLEKKDLCKRLKTETERRLFHGCPNQGDALESIARNGFDRSLAGAHRGKRDIVKKDLNEMSFNYLL